MQCIALQCITVEFSYNLRTLRDGDMQCLAWVGSLNSGDIMCLYCTESVPRREEGSTGKYKHVVKGVPEDAARGNS